MHISRRTDYALRILLYLGLHPGERITLDEIAKSYGISYFHLVKIVKSLNSQGMISPKRGKNGGLVLSKAPHEINIGFLVQAFEPHMNILECFDCQRDRCPITPVCAGRDLFYQARKAFMDVLSGATLADALQNPDALLALFAARKRSVEAVTV
ncbi:MAG: Rrf2 family transcriptional regulator [Mariprofundales bacterium]